MVKPFKVNISDKIINEIYEKVRKYPWHEMPNDGGWEYGTNLDYMKEISKYWVSEFDWRKHEREINKFPNFITKVDDIDIHFIHVKGSGSKPMPLLISHGWPGTIVEFLHIIKISAIMPTAVFTRNIFGHFMPRIFFYLVINVFNDLI